MMKIYEIHNAVFDICFEKHIEFEGQLKFALRKSNRYKRLEHGYWFYGNDEYLAVSFWSGSDWKNKTPNIFFGIFKNGSTFLELTATDSESKLTFIREVLGKKISGLVPTKKGFRKDYMEFGNDFMESLISFLNYEKNLIDVLIRTQANDYFGFNETSFNRIGFIDDTDFNRRLQNVLKYKSTFNPKNIRTKIPEHLQSFSYYGSFPKMNIEIVNLPQDAQWIFFTGLNGTGKTNILRGITSAILNNFDNHYLINDTTFYAKITIKRSNRKLYREVNLNNSKRDQLAKGFAAYGASRLNVMDFSEEQEINKDVIRKTSASYSLFHQDGVLFTIDPIHLRYFDNSLIQKVNTGNPTRLGKFIELIIDLLPDIIPNLTKINFPEKSTLEDLWSLIEYIEEDENGDELPPVEFTELSSGSKSMVAMFGDMLIRLFTNHQNIEDFSEMTGIVLIDEIDVHLHPKYQRLIVEKLTGIFPKIQFIVTTHSPIPLLGAPKGSIFFRVNRTAKEGISVERLTQLEREIEHLLPNTIYTSDIFDLDDISSVQNSNPEQIDTSDNYPEYDLDKRIADQINRINKDLDNEFIKFLSDEKN